MRKHVLFSVLVVVFVMAFLVLVDAQDKMEITLKMVISVLTGTAYYFVFK